MGKYLIIFAILLSNCGAKVQNDYDVGGEALIQVEIITRFPDSARCFDALEAGLLDQETFLICLEHLTEGSYTINLDGEIIEATKEASDKAEESAEDLAESLDELNEQMP